MAGWFWWHRLIMKSVGISVGVCDVIADACLRWPGTTFEMAIPKVVVVYAGRC